MRFKVKNIAAYFSPKQPFLTFLKKICQEIDIKLLKKLAFNAFLMKNALILCNPHDKNLINICCVVSRLHNFFLKIEKCTCHTGITPPPPNHYNIVYYNTAVIRKGDKIGI